MLTLSTGAVPASVSAKDMAVTAAASQICKGDWADFVLGHRAALRAAATKNVSDYVAVKEKGKWGVIDRQGKEIVPCDYEDVKIDAYDKLVYTLDPEFGLVGAFDFSGKNLAAPINNYVGAIDDSLVVVKNGGKYGVYTRGGVEVIPQKQKVLQWNPNEPDSFVISRDEDTYSYVDRNGKPLFSPTFQEATPFMNGRAMIRQNGRYGFIDKTGAVVIPAIYKKAMPFLEDATLVKDDKGIAAIDVNGHELARIAGGELIATFHEGIAVVKNNHKFQYVDTKGAVLTTLDDADYAMTFVNGTALMGRIAYKFSLGGNWGDSADVPVLFPFRGIYGLLADNYKNGYLNHQGVEYIPTKHDFNGSIYRNRLLTRIDGLYGYLAKDGSTVVPAQFKDISDFCGTNDDMVIVKTDAGYSYYKVGTGIIAKTYAMAQPFSDGMAAVAVSDNQWGYVDEQGNQVIPTVYQKASDFVGGAAVVKASDKYGVINKTGQYTVAADGAYEEMKMNENGTIAFKKDGKWGLMDGRGAILVPARYSAIKS